MKLIDRDIRSEQEFQASLHGATLTGASGGGRIGGRRRSYIDRLKAKYRGM